MKLTVLGVPSSIGGRNAGAERAPAALRRAGLLERLREAGHEVEDRGDLPEAPHRPDPDPAHRKQQNLAGVLEVARSLAPRVEAVLRSNRIPLLLGGDCTMALGSFAGATRVHPDLGLAYLDRDADLNTPQTTRSGILHGMVIAHLLGRGIPELARLDGRAPLLRPGRLALLGAERLDPPEVPVYEALPSYRLPTAEIRRQGALRVAQEALKRLEEEGGAFFVHFDVDVVDGGELPGTEFPAPGGLTLVEARILLSNLVDGAGFRGIEVAELNPAKDADGASAARVTDLLVDAFDGGGPRP